MVAVVTFWRGDALSRTVPGKPSCQGLIRQSVFWSFLFPKGGFFPPLRFSYFALEKALECPVCARGVYVCVHRAQTQPAGILGPLGFGWCSTPRSPWGRDPVESAVPGDSLRNWGLDQQLQG